MSEFAILYLSKPANIPLPSYQYIQTDSVVDINEPANYCTTL